MIETVLLAAALTGPTVCKPIPQPPSWVRGNNDTYAIVTAQAESVFTTLRQPVADERPARPSGLGRAHTPGSARSAQGVFAQWARVERVGGAPDSAWRAARGRVALAELRLHFGPGASNCGAEAPVPSTRVLAPGEQAFLLRRPEHDGAAGAWVVYFSTVSDGYSPAWERRRLATAKDVPVLTAADYATFWLALPRVSEWCANYRRAANRLRAWARANPRIAGTAPATEVLRDLERLEPPDERVRWFSCQPLR